MKLTLNRHAFHSRLHEWFNANGRILPWRTSPRDPYSTLISEVMLQQTQVKTVIPYFHRFTKQFPGIASLADAPMPDILKAWQGLGYYSRAKNLQRTAQIIHRERNGFFPASYTGLLTLPGIGPYIAAAIASMVYGESVPVVDGNVKRIIARLFTIDSLPGSASYNRQIHEVSHHLLDTDRPGLHNESLMELGALMCKPRKPECSRCPVRNHCKAFHRKTADRYPRPRIRKSIPEHRYVGSLIWNNPCFLISKRDDSGLLPGLWEIPLWKIDNDQKPVDYLKNKLEAVFDLNTEISDTQFTVRHTYSHFRLKAYIFSCTWSQNGNNHQLNRDRFRWVSRESVKRFPVHRAVEKIIERMNELTVT